MGRLDPGAAGLGGVRSVAGSGDPGPAVEPGGHGAGHGGPEPHFRVDADISALAIVLARLAQLQQQEPERARQVLAAVAALLRAEATTAPSPGLRRLADEFEKAAEEGSLARVQPARLLAGPDGPRRPHGVQSYGAQAPPFDLAEVIRRALQQAGVP